MPSCQNGATIPYPQMTKDLHHEIEMVVAIGKGGADIPVEKALDHVFGYGVGLDMTRRDLQGEAKKMGRPWEMGKAFDNSAPCTGAETGGDGRASGQGRDLAQGQRRSAQQGDLSELIWNVPETIAYLSNLVTLRPGRLIMSGTPAGVGPVKRGDKLEGHVDGVGELTDRLRRSKRGNEFAKPHARAFFRLRHSPARAEPKSATGGR
jgi:fumarylpyruvate hydrolase